MGIESNLTKRILGVQCDGKSIGVCLFQRGEGSSVYACYRMWMKERCQVKAPLVAEVAQRISWTRVWDACMDLWIIDSNISFMHACCIMGNNALEVLVPEAVVVTVRVSIQALCLYIQPTQAWNSVCRESPLIGSVKATYMREKGSWNRWSL